MKNIIDDLLAGASFAVSESVDYEGDPAYVVIAVKYPFAADVVKAARDKFAEVREARLKEALAKQQAQAEKARRDFQQSPLGQILGGPTNAPEGGQLQ